MIDLEKYRNYVQSEIPNQKRITCIVHEIMGNRSAAMYASNIGLNPTRVSRIVNGIYANALDMETLAKLADGDEYNFERLLLANGMLSPKEQEKKNEISARRETMVAYEDRERKANLIIMSELLARGLIIRQSEGLIPKGDGKLLPLRFDSEYIVTDKNSRSYRWFFEICCEPVEKYRDEKGGYSRSKVQSVFARKMQIFLADAWTPELLRGCKFSFVFCDEWVMNEFRHQIVKEKLNNRFSLVLVDLKNLKILKEVVLKGDNDLLVFEWGTINTQHKKRYGYDEDDLDT